MIQFNTFGSCGCFLEETVKSNYEHTDIIFTGKVLNKTSIRRWIRDTTNARTGYLEYTTWYTERGWQADRTYNQFKNWRYSLVMEIEYTFETTKIYKGKAKKKLVKIRSGSDLDCCGFHFNVGQEYLVYAKDKAKRYLKRNQLEAYEERKGTYETSICTLTTNLERATGQLKELKKL